MKENQVGQPTPQSWTLTEAEQLNYQALYILYLMLEKGIVFPNFLGGNLKYVQSAVDFLEEKKLIVQTEKIITGKKVLGVTVKKDDVMWIFEPTAAATGIVEQYKRRYREFLSLYDVFAHVDPTKGEFAFGAFKAIILEEGEEAWQEYKKHPRWVDYRIPVAVYKGIDPREFVFFSFIEEGRFIPTAADTEHEWAKRLFLGDVWEEMYAILASAPKWEEQGDEENEPAEIMETIITEGAGVLEEQLRKIRKYIRKQDYIIGQEAMHERVEGEHRGDYDGYYDNPVYYGSHYTPLSDPLFWLIVL
jgi:hypothetical protein